MTQDTNTTSGAADLRATFSEMLVDLPNTEPYTLFQAGFDAALAAGQATAAQAGVPANMRLCYSCGHPADAHPWVNDPRGGKRRGDCPAAPAQPAAQQPHRSGCTAGTDEACVQRGCGINCPAVSPRQGVAYAALPTSSYAGRVYEEGFLIGTCPLYTADQLHAFADATCALRASRGKAPAETEFPVSAQADSVLAVSDLPPLPAPDLRDVGAKPQEIKEFLKGYATEYARTAIAARAPADSVQEDAARYRFLRDGEWRDTDLEPFIRLQLNTLWDAKIDAARKQGANHDR